MLHSILGYLRAEGLIDNNTVVVLLCQDMFPSTRPLLGLLVHVGLCLPLTRGSLTARCLVACCLVACCLYECCSHNREVRCNIHKH